MTMVWPATLRMAPSEVEVVKELFLWDAVHEELSSVLMG